MFKNWRLGVLLCPFLGDSSGPSGAFACFPGFLGFPAPGAAHGYSARLPEVPRIPRPRCLAFLAVPS
eukprot:2421823-Pyramimonas_sp.AAC.1